MPVAGLALADCPEIFGDTLARVVTWKRGVDLSRLAGKPVRLRFEFKDAALCTFRFAKAPTSPWPGGLETLRGSTRPRQRRLPECPGKTGRVGLRGGRTEIALTEMCRADVLASSVIRTAVESCGVLGYDGNRMTRTCRVAGARGCQAGNVLRTGRFSTETGGASRAKCDCDLLRGSVLGWGSWRDARGRRPAHGRLCRYRVF